MFLDLENTAAKKYGSEDVTTLRMSRQLGINFKLEGNYLKAEKIYKKMANVLNPYGDGRASQRISKILLEENLW